MTLPSQVALVMASLSQPQEAGRCPFRGGSFSSVRQYQAPKVLPGTVQRVEDRAVPWGCTCASQRVLGALQRDTKRLPTPPCPSVCSLESRHKGTEASSGWLPCPQYPARAGPAWHLNQINKAGLRDKKQRHPSTSPSPQPAMHSLRRGQVSPPRYPQELVMVA